MMGKPFLFIAVLGTLASVHGQTLQAERNSIGVNKIGSRIQADFELIFCSSDDDCKNVCEEKCIVTFLWFGFCSNDCPAPQTCQEIDAGELSCEDPDPCETSVDACDADCKKQNPNNQGCCVENTDNVKSRGHTKSTFLNWLLKRERTEDDGSGRIAADKICKCCLEPDLQACPDSSDEECKDLCEPDGDECDKDCKRMHGTNSHGCCDDSSTNVNRGNSESNQFLSMLSDNDVSRQVASTKRCKCCLEIYEDCQNECKCDPVDCESFIECPGQVACCDQSDNICKCLTACQDPSNSCDSSQCDADCKGENSNNQGCCVENDDTTETCKCCLSSQVCPDSGEEDCKAPDLCDNNGAGCIADCKKNTDMTLGCCIDDDPANPNRRSSETSQFLSRLLDSDGNRRVASTERCECCFSYQECPISPDTECKCNPVECAKVGCPTKGEVSCCDQSEACECVASTNGKCPNDTDP